MAPSLSPAQLFKDNEIVPDVLPSVDDHLSKLTVSYGDLQVI